MEKMVPEQMKQAIQEVLAIPGSDLGMLGRWHKILDILQGHKHAYVVPEIHVRHLLCHPDNRAQLGLDPHNVHRVGAMISKLGGDFSQLNHATCVEMSPLGDERAKQVAFNSALVQHAQGLLAPVTGEERYLTLSCGHTAAFCRAAVSSCRTSEQCLADERGTVSTHLLLKDDVLKAMIERGWKWTVISWQAAEAIPEICRVAQAALNSFQSVATLASELEVASSMAQLLGKGLAWQEVLDQLSPSCPHLQQTLEAIGTYVRLFGDSGTMPRFLDKFAKTYGSHMRLGAEFWEAVVAAKFPDSQCMYPMMRTAVLCCNLTAEKSMDGMSRLLTKSDMVKLCAVNMKEKVSQGEKLLVSSWHASGSSDKGFACFGRLCVRLVLFLLSKGKAGREKRDYKTMEEIAGAFDKELSDPSFKQTPETGSDPSSSSGGSELISLQEVGSALWIAQQKGFHLGKYYNIKGSPGQWLLKDLSETEAVFVEHDAIKAKGLTMKLPLDQLKNVSKAKGVQQQQVPEDLVSKCLGINHSEFNNELCRCQVFAAIAALAAECQGEEQHLMFLTGPSALITKKPFKKHELVLVPLVPLSKVLVSGGKESPVQVACEGLAFNINSGMILKDISQLQSPQAPPLAAYWHVACVEEGDFNMEECYLDSNDLKIPCLRNCKALKVHEKLVKLKVKVSGAAASSSAPKKRRTAKGA